MTGGATWNSYTVVSDSADVSNITESLTVPGGPQANSPTYSGHGTIGPGGTTICISFTIVNPNTAAVDNLRFSDLTINDPGCALQGASTFDLHIRLYDEAGFVLYDEDDDQCIASSAYATSCNFHPGLRHIDVNKHREAFVCDENDPDKDIFEAYDFNDPALDCPVLGCTHQPGTDPDTSDPDDTPHVHCTWNARLDPDDGEPCEISQIDAVVEIAGLEQGVCDVLVGAIDLPNVASPPVSNLFRSGVVDGDDIWDIGTHDVDFDLCCQGTTLDPRAFTVEVQRRVGSCNPSDLGPSLIATWVVNGTLLYSTFDSANTKYEQTWWITNYSPLEGRILATVYGMQSDATQGNASVILGAADSVLGWVGSQSTVGFQLSDLVTAIGVPIPSPTLFWVCFTVQTKAVSGHTVLGTLQVGPQGMTADYTVYKHCCPNYPGKRILDRLSP